MFMSLVAQSIETSVCCMYQLTCISSTLLLHKTEVGTCCAGPGDTMNMGSLRTELDVPMSMGQRACHHGVHDSDLEDDDVMMLGSTPKVSSTTFAFTVILAFPAFLNDHAVVQCQLCHLQFAIFVQMCIVLCFCPEARVPAVQSCTKCALCFVQCCSKLTHPQLGPRPATHLDHRPSIRLVSAQLSSAGAQHWGNQAAAAAAAAEAIRSAPVQAPPQAASSSPRRRSRGCRGLG